MIFTIKTPFSSNCLQSVSNRLILIQIAFFVWKLFATHRTFNYDPHAFRKLLYLVIYNIIIITTRYGDFHDSAVTRNCSRGHFKRDLTTLIERRVYQISTALCNLKDPNIRYPSNHSVYVIWPSKRIRRLARDVAETAIHIPRQLCTLLDDTRDFHMTYLTKPTYV